MEYDLHLSCGKAQFTVTFFKAMICKSVCAFVKDHSKSP